MSTWARKLGRAFGQLGTGVQILPPAPPKALPINYSSFRNGLMVADRPADVPVGYYSIALDVETSRRDGVIRAPGVTLIEDTGLSLEWLAVQTGLDFQSVLVAFAAPYIGVREAGNFSWSNQGLPVSSFWVTSRYGDTLLFSNGVLSYARDFNSGLVSIVPDMPGAATLLTVFGRVFAGGVVSDGEYNVLGISWSGVEGDFHDWTGAGSGSELLIADVEQSDKIVAARILSYDLVAILCRRSLWLAARTGDLARPADFQFRLVGIGCVSEPTARTTEGGVTFLSDEGVRHFDGNNAEIISSAINAELLPIDFSKLNLYKSAWDSSRRRYILSTPTATYVYQFRTSEYPTGAWFKRSIKPTNVIVFGRQIADQSWDDLGNASWDDFGELTWFQLGTPESLSAPDVLFASGTRYGFQDSTATTNLGASMSPLFQPRPNEQPAVDMPDRVFATQSFLIEYIGGGTIQILGDDETGVIAVLATVVLPSVTSAATIRTDLLGSSRMTGLYVQITAGFPEILRIRQTVIDNGPVLVNGTPELLSEVATDLLTETSNGIILWP